LDTTRYLVDELPGLQVFLADQAKRAEEKDSNASDSDDSDSDDPGLPYLTLSPFLKERLPDLEATLTYTDPFTDEALSDLTGLLLDTGGFVQHEGVLHLNVCSHCCTGSFKKGGLPACAIANDNWVGAPDPSSAIAVDFQSLTWGEMQLLALERTKIVLQLRGAKALRKDLKQRGAVGNAVAYHHATKKVCTMLPRPVTSLLEVLKVIFRGSRPVTADDIKWAAQVDLPKVLRCFVWLQDHHPDYEDIELHTDYDNLDLNQAPFVPKCVLACVTQLNEEDFADGAHASAGHGNAPASLSSEESSSSSSSSSSSHGDDGDDDSEGSQIETTSSASESEVDQPKSARSGDDHSDLSRALDSDSAASHGSPSSSGINEYILGSASAGTTSDDLMSSEPHIPHRPQQGGGRSDPRRASDPDDGAASDDSLCWGPHTTHRLQECA
jgi:hypothetical protein